MNVIIKHNCEMLVSALVPCLSNGGNTWKGMGSWRAADATARRGLAEDPSVLDLQHSDGVKCVAQLCTLS